MHGLLAEQQFGSATGVFQESAEGRAASAAFVAAPAWEVGSTRLPANRVASVSRRMSARERVMSVVISFRFESGRPKE